MESKRRNFKMTEEELAELLSACGLVQYMVIDGKIPSSPQEKANEVWARLGIKYGFNFMTVESRPGKEDRFFSAIPNKKRRDVTKLYILFDGPPGPTSGHFIEVEQENGASINLGEWEELEAGLWALVIPDFRAMEKQINDALYHLRGDSETANTKELIRLAIRSLTTLPKW